MTWMSIAQPWLSRSEVFGSTIKSSSPPNGMVGVAHAPYSLTQMDSGFQQDGVGGLGLSRAGEERSGDASLSLDFADSTGSFVETNI